MSATSETGVPRPPVLARLRPRQWFVVDLAIGLGYGAFAAAVEGTRPASPALVAALGLLTGTAIWLTRSSPLVGLAIALVAAVLAPLESDVGWLALAPVGYALWRVGVDRDSRTTAIATTVAMVSPVATALPDFQHSGGIGPFAVVLLLCSGIGMAVGAQRRYAAGVQRHQEERTATAVADGRRALLEERLKLARELHDVVAHTLSIVTVQAAYGHVVFDEHPAQARKALEDIEAAGREASREMRRLLGVLRDEGSDLAPELAPSPGLADLQRLAAQTTAAGVTVTLDVSGPPRPLPAGLELTAYRIVQEALTNVVRHARTSTAHVEVACASEVLRIRVSDRGAGDEAGPVDGHGLVGMRERVELYGGTLTAGNRTDGAGFVVEATLPLAAVAEPHALVT
jgi:signal transduction histidine kinase